MIDAESGQGAKFAKAALVIQPASDALTSKAIIILIDFFKGLQ